MATARAVAQLIHSIINSIRSLVFLVRSGPEIVCVATRAVGPIRREGIGLRLAVRGMTVAALACRMAGREIAEMAVGHAGPGCGPVTGIALLGRDEMARGLARGADPVVARGTAAGDA